MHPCPLCAAPLARGLDYGSGPAPALTRMLEGRGFPTSVWDPIFAPEPAPLARTHDFVACTEAAEHFFHPADELARLDRLLRPGGWLGMMTEMADGRDLAAWRYARDPTHVSLYRAETMGWIARRFGWSLEAPAPNVFLFRKG